MFPSFLGLGQKRNNIISMELFGNGLYYSMNYERNFDSDKTIKVNPRIGVTVMGSDFNALPVEAVFIVGKKKHRLETGLGVTPSIEKRGKIVANGNIITRSTFVFRTYILSRIGYRYEAKSGFLLKLGVTPVLYPQFFPWPALTIGKSF